MPDRSFDHLVVGAGIVGLAVAREMLRRRPGTRAAVLEKEAQIARHQTGHNSGVIHSGVAYRPGSLKARLCVEGREKLLRFCEKHDVPFRIAGKLIVAATKEELPALDAIAERGRANGVEGIVRVQPERIAEYEPHARGEGALWVPGAGIVDYGRVAEAIAQEVRGLGGEILLGWEVIGAKQRHEAVILKTTQGSVRAGRVIACAGPQSDRVAEAFGHRADVRILPFRGDYYLLRSEARGLVRSMIYPVADPRFPFLGVHFTRRMDGEVLAGPNAVLSAAREGCGRFRLRLADAWSTATWPGFWRLARLHWRTGLSELEGDWLRMAYARRLRRLVPEIRTADLLPGPCGIRAQAVGRDGTLQDDFAIVTDERALHVLNAPSPAATSALAIAREIVDRSEMAWGSAGGDGKQARA